jgi:hypothetical protein
MFFASFTLEKNRRLLRHAGFELVLDRAFRTRSQGTGPCRSCGFWQDRALEGLGLQSGPGVGDLRVRLHVVTAVPLTLPDGEAHVVCIRLGAGRVLGRHPAPVDQLFVVVEGRAGRVAMRGNACLWLRGQRSTGTPGRSTVESKPLVPHLRDD